MYVWTAGPLTCRLGPKEIGMISTRLIKFRKHMSVDFNRKCRSLKDLKHWKATEFRTFMLYLGPAALINILKVKFYNHFLLFHASMLILCSESAFKPTWVSYAGSLLNDFVDSVSDIYYKDLLVFNMHTLKHLHLDVEIHGPVDRFSAFEFENSMQFLKRLIRSKNSHLSQVVRRLHEGSDSQLVESKPFTKLRLSEKSGDNCILNKDRKVYLVTKVLNNDEFECLRFNSFEDIEGYPSSSVNSLCIGIVSSLSTKSYIVKIEEISKKCILLPLSHKFVCIPLCHT